jgi:D-alanine transaminase
MQVSEPIIYLNGDYLPQGQARISPLDRGFLFGDAVYEVIPLYDGKVFLFDGHWQRLCNSLAAIDLKANFAQHELNALIQQLQQANGLLGMDSFLYLQISRGVFDKRDHAFTDVQAAPTIFAYLKPLPPLPEMLLREGVHAIVLPDQRWHGCAIKTVNLLANVLARQQAWAAHCQEALLVADDLVLEGAASNIFVLFQNKLYTAPKSTNILPGITRDFVLKLAVQCDIAVQETAPSLAMLKAAQEVWMSSSTKEVLPVTRIDNQAVAEGVPGEKWRQVFARYQSQKRGL